MSAAGRGDGQYRLGGRQVLVRGGQARTADGRLAGSTLTMDAAFRRLVRDVGVPIQQAVKAASTTPVRLLGMADRCGAIAPGLAADLIELSDKMRVRRVMLDGEWSTPRN